MKTIRKVLWLAVAAVVVTASAWAGDLYFYIDFDGHPAGTYQEGDQYAISPADDVTSGVTGIYFEVLGGNGVVIKTPDGTDGANFPATPGPQGGQAMLVEGAGMDEGLNVELSSPLPPDDFTVEIVYWSATNNIAVNTAAIQTLVSSEWPNQQYYNGVLRIVGDAIQGVGANVPFVAEAIAQTGTLVPAQWHTVQYVFDLNDADRTNSSITVYMDGSQAAQTTIDVSDNPPSVLDSGWSIFGVPLTGARTGVGSWRFTIAASTSRIINGSDNRGLLGAVDAVAVSRGALTPAEFILPTGFTPTLPTESQGIWTLYE